MIEDQVVYEDNHLIAVNKRPSQLCQGDSTGDLTLVDHIKLYLKAKYNKPGNVYLGVIHRIDRPVSGVVIYARTSKALPRMNNMFRDGNIQKTYYAVVEGHVDVPEARLVHFMTRNQGQNKSYVSDTRKPESKEAILSYKVVKSLDNYTLLRIQLETGRHHQIRAQLAHIGFPIKGDVKYGARRANKDRSIHLHAHSIEFIHPVSKEEIRISSAPPADRIWELVANKM